ncbi:DUF3108 domain-containing protein [Arenibaculum pallidiluteum]|uniref:DUF3108 domain-containing protein n=1 Tax=Arenibaculum pallidiluteum TaxID=2812559 RepID=UPI001A963670|nr:DUF3108 domain-containing protein [Arenibaculum pallidiluteum]
MHVRLLPALVLLLAAPSAWPRAEAAPSPSDVALRYAIHVGGLHAFDAGIVARLHEGRYELEGEAASRGLADWLASFRGRSRAEGTLVPSGARPERYRSDRTFRGSARTVTVEYGNGGVAEAVEPPAARQDRDPVPDAVKPGTVDPLSAGLSTVLAAFRDGRCGGTERIFDGLARYDLVASDTGTAALTATSYGIYSGPAIRCSLDQRMLAGFWRGRSASSANQADRRPMTLWLAPIGPGGLPLPVRAELEGWFGSVVVHLVGGTGLELGADAAEAVPAP